MWTAFQARQEPSLVDGMVRLFCGMAELSHSSAGATFAALAAVMLPSVTMMLGSILVLWCSVPEKLQACAQNFSAGLLISAVAGELFPLLSGKTLTPVSEVNSCVCLCTGFLLGLLFMFGLEHITGDPGVVCARNNSKLASSDSSSSLDSALMTDAEVAPAVQAFAADVSDLLRWEVGQLEHCLDPPGLLEGIDEILHVLMYRGERARRCLEQPEPFQPQNLCRMRFHVGELREKCKMMTQLTSIKEARQNLKDFNSIVQHLHQQSESANPRMRRWQTVRRTSMLEPVSDKISWALVSGVTADAAVDGLLIGLAYSASPSAGWSMSFATCIEMGFLGLTFSATLQTETHSRVKIVGVSLVPPLVLLLFGVAGHALGRILESTPDLFIGFIAFSIVALLFLVTQELLAEAHEVASDNLIVNVMFFAGLLGGILLEKFLD